jgi:diguanylate cyclase (GGDEF)-like protein
MSGSELRAEKAGPSSGWFAWVPRFWRARAPAAASDQLVPARVDALTGLPNRLALAEALAVTVGHVGAMALLDVDHFKQINDRHGHVAGDRVLGQLGELLRALLAPEGRCFRVGGDEFVVLFAGIGLNEAERRVADLMGKLRAGAVVAAQGAEPVKVSAGLCDLTQQSEDRVMSAADAAMYVAKARGRDRLVRFDDGLRTVISARRELTVTVAALQQQNEALVREARTDALTGLRNTLALNECLAQLDAEDQGAAFAFLDVDHFGQYNHLYGDAAGDEVLRRLAAELAAQTRDGEIPHRKGGEEFVVVLPQGTLLDARQLGERLRARIEALQIPHRGSEAAAVLTLSVGVAARRRGEPARLAMDRAAHQTMQAKVSGRRNAVHVDEELGPA